MTPEEAREIAAQCWCDKRTETYMMDTTLSIVFSETLLSVASQVREETIRECADKVFKMDHEPSVIEIYQKLLSLLSPEQKESK